MREFQRVLLKTGLGEGLRPRWAQPILILRAKNRSHTESQQEQKERGDLTPPPWLAVSCMRTLAWPPRFQTVPVGRGFSTTVP